MQGRVFSCFARIERPLRVSCISIEYFTIFFTHPIFTVSVPRVIVRNLERRGVREGDKEEIRNTCREFGPVTNVWMADDPPGFAYVFFEAFKDALKAVEELNNTRMCGHRVTVELSPSEDKRKNRGGWNARFGIGDGEKGGGGSEGYGGGDRAGGGGYRDNYRPRGRGSYHRDSREDNRGGRDYDNRGGQRSSEYRDSYGGRGRGGGVRGGNYRGGGGGGGGYRGRGGGSGGGYQQKWGGRGGGYGSSSRDEGGYRSGFNRDRNSGDGYNSDRDRGGSGRHYQSSGGSGSRGRSGYYERDSFERRSRREDDNLSDDGSHSRSKDYEYRERRSYTAGSSDHKLQEHSRSKRYPSSSPEYVKESHSRSTKYRKRSDGEEFQTHRSGSEYHHSQSGGGVEPSTKWEASPYRQRRGGSPEGSFNRSRSHSRSPFDAEPEYYSPPPPPTQDNYRGSRKPMEKSIGSFEHLPVDQFQPMDDAYSSNRSFERRADFSPEPAEPTTSHHQYTDYRDRDRMVKYGDLPESRSSRHYKSSSKRSGSEEPLEPHKVHEIESGGRYIKLDEKSVRSRGRDRSHSRLYPTSSREHRRSSPSRHASPPPPPPPPPPHTKRSVISLII